MHYTSVLLDTSGALKRTLSSGSSHAYWIVPVHLDDHHLLGFWWDNKVFIDIALHFGLRLAPKIFSAVADALVWILHSNGVTHQLHYLDDFLLLGVLKSPQCAEALAITYHTCSKVGVAIAAHKTEGPSCRLTFLGIQIHSIGMEVSLPADKLARTIATVQSWTRKKAASKRELQSLIGTLRCYPARHSYGSS